jgi:hypothetical protein
MKKHTFLAPLLSLSLLGIALGGCSTFQNRNSPSATRPVGGKSMELLELRDDVKIARVSIDRTIGALDRLPDSPAPRESYKQFSSELAAFQKDAERALDQTDEVRDRGRDLFAEWTAESMSINNPDIRAAAEQRRATLESSYASMMTPLAAARTDLTALRSDLIDIQKALALDLTPAGIDSVESSFDEIRRKADASRRSLDALTAELNKIAGTLPAPTVATIEE